MIVKDDKQSKVRRFTQVDIDNAVAAAEPRTATDKTFAAETLMIEDMTNWFTAQELEQIAQIIQNAAPVNVPTGSGEVKLAAPTLFEGSINQTIEFIDSVTDYVTANASRFPNNKQKIIFMKSYIKGGLWE